MSGWVRGDTSCPDWAERLRLGESIIPPPLYPEVAEQAVEVFKQLKIVDAPGSPTFGESCAPWVFDLVASVFGSYNVDTGRREVTEWFILLPKKNSKSTVAAAIMLTALILNWRQSAQFTILSPTVEIATNSFSPARDMVKHDDVLDDMAHVQTHIKTITHKGTGAFLKVLAADSNTVGGVKSVGTLVDELHLFGKLKNAENMFREALGGLASRPEGFVIWLTTQSDEPPAGMFKQKLDYARDVRDGKIIDKRFVPVIFEHPPEMVENGDCLKLENMAMVNPNLGYSVDEEFLEREYTKAKSAGEESFRGFMAKHANVEIGLNLRSDRWAGAEFWEAAQVDIDLDGLIERSEVITVGIDGGGLDDLLGFYVMGRCKETGKKLGWGYAWAHPSVLERRQEIAPALRDFAKEGSLTLAQHVGEDVDELADIVEQIHASGKLFQIGVDSAGLGGILDKLEERGIPEDMIVAVSQGWRLGGAIKTTERWLAEGSFTPAKQSMMAWSVGNARVEPRANSIMITKQKSGSAKIDPVMGMLNAAALMATNPAASGEKYRMFVLG